jgi:Tfp pilus assembly major pilin PilA
MNEPTLDDQLKQAQIAKTHAETSKLAQEAEAVSKNVRSGFWSETIKILGGVVLGIGGFFAAHSQYELSELKAKMANEVLAKAQGATALAVQARLAAETAAAAAMAKRDVALREQRDAEAAVAELKVTLTKTDSALQTATPGASKGRLAFIQFRGELKRDLINQLRLSLAEKSFDAPGAERVGGDYQNLVKYFKPTDSGDAERLASAVESFFAAKGCPIKLRAVSASATAVANPPLEVWLTLKCSGN